MRFLLFLILIAGCQIQDEESKAPDLRKSSVINGSGVGAQSNNLANSAAALITSNGICSGTLIASRVVLTASHCVASSKPSHIFLGVTASINSITPDKLTGRYKVEKIIPHTSFNPEKPFEVGTVDLAIIILEEDAKAPFKPMKIDDSFDMKAENTSLITAGFSHFSEPIAEDFFHLLTGIDLSWAYRNSGGLYITKELNLLSRAVIQSGETYDQDTFISHQYSGGACSGDSGGPTMIRKNGDFFLVGVNRAVTGLHFNEINKKFKAACEYQLYSTSVSFHKEWILDTVNEARVKAPEFLNNTDDVDESEKNCALQIKRNINIYKSLFQAEKETCQNLSGVDMLENLKKLEVTCKSNCSKIKEYDGQCEFYAKGAVDMADYFRMACKELI